MSIPKFFKCEVVEWGPLFILGHLTWNYPYVKIILLYNLRSELLPWLKAVPVEYIGHGCARVAHCVTAR